MFARRIVFAAIGALTAFGSVLAAPMAADGHWVDSWTSMPQLTETANLPPAPFTQATVVFKDSTIRQTLQLSLDTGRIRIRISNAFGTTDLPITAVTVALPVNGSPGVSGIQTQTLKTVTFSGSASVVIPNGALVVSDPIDFPIKSQQNIAITIYTNQGQTTNNITSHPGSRITSYFVAGNKVTAADLPGAANAAHWYFLSAVEAWVPLESTSFVIVGDSITDGRGSTTDANNRWPNLLLAKMQQNAQTKNIGVVNQAAGGNRILADGLGPNALGRIDRDVLAQSAVGFAMIFEGVNDIGTADTSVAAQQQVGDRLIWAFKQIATRIQEQGIPIFAATITPFSGNPSQAYSNPEREKTRQRVNEFIRNSGTFDAVVDFDAILRNPSAVSQLAPQFDSGDGLHPNVAGYQAIANAFPLDIFQKFRKGKQ